MNTKRLQSHSRASKPVALVLASCLLALIAVLPFANQACARPTSGPPPYDKLEQYEKPGGHHIKALHFKNLKDHKRRNRPVEMRVYMPRDGGPYPLVIISHSAGGIYDSHRFQAEHLASHGYIVICIEHVDSNNVSVKFYMSKAGGSESLREAMHHVTTDAVAVLERPRDISFAIDCAHAWNKSHKELAGRINTRKIAVMGHSFGAYTAMAAIGAQPVLDHLKPRTGSGKGLAGPLGDQRISFALAMSPPGPGSKFFDEDSFKSVNKPLVMISGSKDEQKGYDGKIMPPETRREIFPLLPPGNKYFLWLANADHVSFTDNHSMWLLPSAARKDVQRITKALMVISCDHFLKGRYDARKSMKARYIRTMRGEVVNELEWLEK